MAEQRATSPAPSKTAGAIRAGSGAHTVALGALPTIDARAGSSMAHGRIGEGERIQVGLMHTPRGTGLRPRALKGALIDIPANVTHSARATPDDDVIFPTAKDMSHGIAGTAVDASIARPRYARGFTPQR